MVSTAVWGFGDDVSRRAGVSGLAGDPAAGFVQHDEPKTVGSELGRGGVVFLEILFFLCSLSLTQWLLKINVIFYLMQSLLVAFEIGLDH